MKKLTITLMAALAGLLLTTQAFAWGPGSGRGNCAYREAGPESLMPESLMMFVNSIMIGHCASRGAGLERLDLTNDQKVKIEALQTAHEKDTKVLREKIFDKSVELRRLWLAATPDKDKINTAQKELRTLRDELQDKSTNMKLEVRKVLTPEQNEKLTNMGWGRGSGFGPRGGMRGYGESGRGYGPGLGMGMCQ